MATSSGPARIPEHLGVTELLGRRAGDHEQPVAQSVQVDPGLAADRFDMSERDQLALRSAAHRSSEVGCAAGRAAAWKDALGCSRSRSVRYQIR